MFLNNIDWAFSSQVYKNRVQSGQIASYEIYIKQFEISSQKLSSFYQNGKGNDNTYPKRERKIKKQLKLPPNYI